MAKDPAFLFYSQDFIVGVQTMPFEDRGKYITILCQMHQQGRMSEETIRFLVGSVSDTLRLKFKVDERGLWFNERLELETEKRNHFTETRRKNGNLGGRPKESKPIGYPKGKPTNNQKGNLMGNENVIENEDEDVIKSKKESVSKLEIFEELFSDERYMEGLVMAHKGKDFKAAFEECYIHHSNAPNPPQALWEWKQKLNTWLTIKRNGTSKKQSTTDLAEAFRRRGLQDAPEGQA